MPKGVYPRTEKHRAAMRERWEKDSERREKQSERMINDNPMKKLEAQEKIRIARTGVLFSEEHKQHLRKPKSPEGRASIKRAHNIPEVRKNHSVASKEIASRPEVKAKLKKYRQDPEWVERYWRAVRKGLKTKVNKPEKFLWKLLQLFFSKLYQINTDGSVLILNGRTPDFVSTNSQKKIIEMFGDYWHGEIRTGVSNKQHEQERIAYFAKEGYQTLIIWEHELKNLDLVVEKIKEFTKL